MSFTASAAACSIAAAAVALVSCKTVLVASSAFLVASSSALVSSSSASVAAAAAVSAAATTSFFSKSTRRVSRDSICKNISSITAFCSSKVAWTRAAFSFAKVIAASAWAWPRSASLRATAANAAASSACATNPSAVSALASEPAIVVSAISRAASASNARSIALAASVPSSRRTTRISPSSSSSAANRPLCGWTSFSRSRCSMRERRACISTRIRTTSGGHSASFRSASISVSFPASSPAAVVFFLSASSRKRSTIFVDCRFFSSRLESSSTSASFEVSCSVCALAANAAAAATRFARATCCSSRATAPASTPPPPPAAMSARKRDTSNASSWALPSTTSFKVAFTLTSFARCANFSVLRVSSSCPVAGETHASNVHRALPPSASFSRYVNFESRYGTCLSFPSATSTRAFITLPSADSDLLIALASFSLAPPASVLFWRSLPARSTRCSSALLF